MNIQSNVQMPGTIKPPRSKTFRETYANALAKGVTPEQAERLAYAVYEAHRPRK